MKKHATLAQAQDGSPISAPTLRDIIDSSLSYTPATDLTAIIGDDVEVSIGGSISLTLLAGTSLALKAGVKYDFNVSVPIGIS